MEHLVNLIGFQRAEFYVAASLFTKRFFTQVALAVVGIISIVFSGPNPTYWLSFFSFGLFLVWVGLEIKYRKVRSNAERARRATLIMGGLGKPISTTEIHDIREAMTATEEAAAAYAESGYYASMSPAGPQRLAEMLEEAAYWTLNLQKLSETIMSGAFVFVLLISGGSFLAVLPLVGGENNALGIARIVCSVVIFATGSDMFLTAWSYKDTYKNLERIMQRLDAARARRYPETELLMLLCDYNAAVEATPLSLPFVYRLRKASLNRNWQNRRGGA